jgi:hypothetical protein
LNTQKKRKEKKRAYKVLKIQITLKTWLKKSLEAKGYSQAPKSHKIKHNFTHPPSPLPQTHNKMGCLSPSLSNLQIFLQLGMNG